MLNLYTSIENNTELTSVKDIYKNTIVNNIDNIVPHVKKFVLSLERLNVNNIQLCLYFVLILLHLYNNNRRLYNKISLRDE